MLGDSVNSNNLFALKKKKKTIFLKKSSGSERNLVKNFIKNFLFFQNNINVLVELQIFFYFVRCLFLPKMGSSRAKAAAIDWFVSFRKM